MGAGWGIRQILAFAVVFAAPITSVLGQSPTGGSSGSTTAAKGLDAYGWDFPSQKLIVVALNAPDVKLPDYFGPSTNQHFDEKSLFPTPPNTDPPKTKAPDGLPPLAPQDPAITIPDGSPPPPPPRKRWKGAAEFGLNGSQGNSDVLSIRIGLNADRKVENNHFYANFLYFFAQQDGSITQHQAFLNARDEYQFAGTPWSLFSALQIEFDQLRAYDFRIGEYAGFSYRWLKSENTLLKTRLGAGIVREIDTRNTAPDRWVPEAVIGGDLNHRFTDRQAYVSSCDVYPNLGQLGQYRVRVRAGYEIVLDPTHGMVLRVGVQDRYDTITGPAKRNDLNYFTTLMFKF